MNEVFASEPNACASISELRELLSKFGPSSGRYLAEFPEGWAKLVCNAFDGAPDYEKKRLEVLLERSLSAFIGPAHTRLRYRQDRDWISNALPLAISPKPLLDGIVVRNPLPDSSVCHTLDSLDLPPTSQELMPPTPADFVRVSRSLLLVSPELYFIDPYCSPCHNNIRTVLIAMLRMVATGSCRRVVICARKKTVVPELGRYPVTESDVRADLQRVRRESSLPTACKLELQLFDDTISRTRMHARYLLSVRGGISFDRGFQAASASKFMDVAPVQTKVHKDLWSYYVFGDHDMKLCSTIEA